MNDAVTTVIESLGDWRGALLARVRATILAADAEVVEEVKWRKPTNPLGVPTWSRGGIICTGESYGDKVKLTFPRGRDLDTPGGLFNGPATGVRRAVDLRRGDVLDIEALTVLVRRAIALNLTGAAREG